MRIKSTFPVDKKTWHYYNEIANKTWQRTIFVPWDRRLSVNKEEILRKSRNENQNKDIYELDVIRKAQRVAGLTAVSVTFALMLLERVVLERGTNYGYFLIIMSAGMGLWIYKAVKMRKKHEVLLAILWTVVAIYAAVMVVLGLIR